MKRETRITATTERVIEIPGGQPWCAVCGDGAPMLTVEQAAAMARLGTGVIRHWIDHNEFHHQPSRAGLPRVCQRSFLAHLKRLDFLPRPKPVARPETA